MKRPFNMRLDRELYSQVCQLAIDNDVSMTQIIEEAITYYKCNFEQIKGLRQYLLIKAIENKKLNVNTQNLLSKYNEK